eukprot:s110_g9.t1
MLSSKSTFASFWRSLQCLEPSVDGGTAPALWPLPLPYPQVCLHEQKGSVDLPFPVRARQKALNLCVAALSWLHLKKPSRAPAVMASGTKLSHQQKLIVRRLEKFFAEISADGNVGPKEMGRTAAKFESLDDVIDELYVQTAHLERQSYGPSAAAGRSNVELKRGHFSKAVGGIIGKTRVGVPAQAKPLVASRLSLPKDPPLFDPSVLLEEPYYQVYEDPVSLAHDHDLDFPVPRVRVHGSSAQTWEFVKLLDSHHRLCLAPKRKIRPGLLCGAFALGKDADSDRLILDARPPNAVEPTYTEWVKTLGSVQALLQIEMRPGFCMRFSGTDLKDYYYSYKVSAARAHRNALRLPLLPAQARHLAAYRPELELEQDQLIYPCLKTMAMGDNNAVELGQLCHVKIGLHCGVFAPSDLLCIHGRAPRGLLAAGVVIDDVLFAEQIPCRENAREGQMDGLTEGAKRLSALCEEYLNKGLNPHPKKTVREAAETDIWGAHINGDSGIIRPAARRLVPLLHVTVQVARLAVASVALLEVLCGAWMSILQFRRRMMCLLDLCYAAQVERERCDVIALSAEAVAELWMLVILSPLAATDLKAQSIDEIFLTDASEDAVAGVKAVVGKTFTAELQRHCLTRGAWARLLSPWQLWLKQHGRLEAEAELPEGVPLVCHPLWVKLAKTLQFTFKFLFAVKKRRHINLLELQGILEIERRLSLTRGDARYALGADSQVALASVVKGRSSSPHLNAMLQESLATLLGAGLYGNYGFLPSLVNVADDPTRSTEIRAPVEEVPSWLAAALEGQFEELDLWLVQQGYSPIQLAQIPCSDDVGTVSRSAEAGLVQELRSVAKPERLAAFDAKHQVAFVENQEKSREHKESEDQTKRRKKSPTKNAWKAEEGPPSHSVASKEVAPPLNKVTKLELECEGQRNFVAEENAKSPALTSSARDLLLRLEPQQFILPGGKRARSAEQIRKLGRAGFLDLYSGEAGVAKELAKRFNVWVVTWDSVAGPAQDLLDPKVQRLVFQLLEEGAVLGVGAAPECASFSRAVVPPVRDALHPEGKAGITANMELKVLRGNAHADFCWHVVARAKALGLSFWLENPDGSFIWLMPEFLRRKLGDPAEAFRFDMCRYGTQWRKRTRIATNTCLAGCRELCLGGHSHQRLRGRSVVHKCSWTRVAQVYPKALCKDLACAMALRAGLVSVRQVKLSIGACAKCADQRIGEAANPGPRVPHAAEPRREAFELVNTQLVEDATLHLQDQVWLRFVRWLRSHLSSDTCDQLFLCPPLAAKIFERYGVHLFASGAGLYELRHLLVLVQQQKPELKMHLNPAWRLVTKWEQIRPLQHRTPLPKILYMAMVSVSLCWRMKRWAAALMIGFLGMTRIGEALAACRCDLLLPSDNFDTTVSSAFLKIRKPKTRKRGKGRVQHAKFDHFEEIQFLERHISQLDPGAQIFPLSAAAFRSRWEKILEALKIPFRVRPTPASVRGGGAIAAYRQGKPIQDLLWGMRIGSQSTLESYLQELAADNFLVRLPQDAKTKIRHAAALYPFLIAQ